MLRHHLEVNPVLIRIHFWLYNECHWRGKNSYFSKLTVSVLLHKMLLVMFFKLICLYLKLCPEVQVRMPSWTLASLFHLYLLCILSVISHLETHSHFPAIRAGAAISHTIILFFLPKRLMCHVSLKPVLTQRLPHFQITKELSNVRGQGSYEGYSQASSVAKIQKTFQINENSHTESHSF